MFPVLDDLSMTLLRRAGLSFGNGNKRYDGSKPRLLLFCTKQRTERNGGVSIEVSNYRTTIINNLEEPALVQ
jgi:hypothetical protein